MAFGSLRDVGQYFHQAKGEKLDFKSIWIPFRTLGVTFNSQAQILLNSIYTKFLCWYFSLSL